MPVDALEQAVPSADWLTYARWTTRTPFTDPRPVAALSAALAKEPEWAGCSAAGRAAWAQLQRRAGAAWDQARQAAGPPGYRAIAACARSLTTASPATRSESHSLAAIASQARSHDDALRPWTTASGAWLAAVAQDGDLNDGRRALLAALLDAYGGAPVRDLALLPALTAHRQRCQVWPSMAVP